MFTPNTLTINATVQSGNAITATSTQGGTITGSVTAGAPGANGTPGAAGPNTVTSSTTTTYSGLLKGNGSNVVVASAADIPNITEAQVTNLTADLAAKTTKGFAIAMAVAL